MIRSSYPLSIRSLTSQLIRPKLIALCVVSAAMVAGCSAGSGLEDPTVSAEAEGVAESTEALAAADARAASFHATPLFRLRLRLMTADLQNAETRSPIYVSINGVRHNLDSPFNDFERFNGTPGVRNGYDQSADHFYELPIATLRTLGDITSVAVGHGATTDYWTMARYELWANDTANNELQPLPTYRGTRPSTSSAFLLAAATVNRTLGNSSYTIYQKNRANPGEVISNEALALQRQYFCGGRAISVPPTQMHGAVERDMARYGFSDVSGMHLVRFSDVSNSYTYHLPFKDGYLDEATFTPCGAYSFQREHAPLIRGTMRAFPNWMCEGGATMDVTQTGWMTVNVTRPPTACR